MPLRATRAGDSASVPGPKRISGAVRNENFTADSGPRIWEEIGVFLANARHGHQWANGFSPSQVMLGSLVIFEVVFALVDFIEEKSAGVVCAAKNVETDVARLGAGSLMVVFRGFDEIIDAFGQDLDSDADDVHGAPISSDDDERNGQVGVDVSDLGYVALFAKGAEAEQRYVGKARGQPGENFVDAVAKRAGASGAINQECATSVFDTEFRCIDASIDEAVHDIDEAIAGAGHEAYGRAFGGFCENVDVALGICVGRMQ